MNELIIFMFTFMYFVVGQLVMIVGVPLTIWYRAGDLARQKRFKQSAFMWILGGLSMLSSIGAWKWYLAFNFPDTEPGVGRLAVFLLTGFTVIVAFVCTGVAVWILTQYHNGSYRFDRQARRLVKEAME